MTALRWDPMAKDRKTEVWRRKDGRPWRIGRDSNVAWIEQNTESGLTIMSAIPPVFDAYATLELPGASDASSGAELKQNEKDQDRQDAGVLVSCLSFDLLVG